MGILTVEFSKINDNGEIKITSINTDRGIMFSKTTSEPISEGSNYPHLVNIMLRTIQSEKPDQVIFDYYGTEEGIKDLLSQQINNLTNIKIENNGKLTYREKQYNFSFI